MKMKALAYIRVSSQEQINGTSLRDQESRIMAYATLKGLEIVRIFSDPGVSGSIPLGKRPAGSEMIEALLNKVANHVIICKLDRGFRSASDCLTTLESWQKEGIRLHIIDLGGNAVDTASASGKFMLSVLAAAAEMERSMIKERCVAGRRARKLQGKCIGQLQFGFSLLEDGKTLTPNTAEQLVIAVILELHRAGLSLRAIARELGVRGYHSKKGGSWSHRQVASVIRLAA
jgi:DNA invertase Pin-like site-specific DNA recombinase